MKNAALTFFLLIWLFMGVMPRVLAQMEELEEISQDKVLSSEECLKELKARVARDRLYSRWVPDSCISYKEELSRDTYIDFAVIEKYGGKCSVDKGESTLLDRFRVYRITRQILWYDSARDEWVATSAVKKKRAISLYQD